MKSRLFAAFIALAVALLFVAPVQASQFMKINIFDSQAIGKLGTATSQIIAKIPLGITRLAYLAKVTGDGNVAVKAQGGPLTTAGTYIEVLNPADNATDSTTVSLDMIDNLTAVGGDGTGGYFSALATTALPLATHYKFIATESDNETAVLSLDLLIEY